MRRRRQIGIAVVGAVLLGTIVQMRGVSFVECGVESPQGVAGQNGVVSVRYIGWGAKLQTITVRYQPHIPHRSRTRTAHRRRLQLRHKRSGLRAADLLSSDFWVGGVDHVGYVTHDERADPSTKFGLPPPRHDVAVMAYTGALAP